MADELDLTDAVELSEEELNAGTIRRSDPGKQALAGLSDIATGIPALLGLAGAGIEAGWDTATGEGGISDNFVKALSEGKDKWLLEKGIGGRNWVNEALGIQEPVSTEDQAARLAASLIPIPGLGIIGGASKAAGLARGVGNVLTPVVKMTKKSKYPHRDKLLGKVTEGTYLHKGNVGRAGAQLGIGTGIEQGIRGYMENPDMPLMFSKEAIEGVTPQDQVISGGEGDEVLGGGAGDDQLTSGIELSPEELSQGTILSNTTEISPEVVAERPPALRPSMSEADKAAEEADTSNIIRNTAIIGGSAIALLAAAKYGHAKSVTGLPTVSGAASGKKISGAEESINTIKESMAQARQAGKPSVAVGKAFDDSVAGAGWTATKRIAADTTNRVFGKAFDKNEHTEMFLRAQGVPEKDIAQLAGQDIADSFGMTQQWIKDGIFGQGSDVVVRPLKDIVKQFARLSDDEKQIFTNGVAAMREGVVRNRATALDALKLDRQNLLGNTGLIEAFKTGRADELAFILKEQEELIASIRGRRERTMPGMWKGAKDPVTDPELKRMINDMTANPVLVRMQRDLAKMNEAILDEAVKRGTLSKEVANGWKKQFTFGEGQNKMSLYTPGKEISERAAWWKRLATNMGVHTSQGKNLRGVSNWMLQGLDHGKGIRNPLDVFHSTANYAHQVMEHTNRSVAQWNVLSRLTNLTLGKGNAPIIGKAVANDAVEAVRFVGKVSLSHPKNAKGNMFTQYAKDDIIRQKFGVGEDAVVPPHMLAEMEDVIWVQRQGDYYGFHVPDRHLKAALEFDSALHNRVLKFGNSTKNMFTQLTTGKFSPFAPTSFIYNNSIASLNAALRFEAPDGKFVTSLLGSPKAAIQVWADGFRGAWEILATRTASDIADITAENIARNTQLGRQNPQWLKGVHETMSRRVRDSLLNPLERETGKSASSLAASEFTGNLTNILEDSIPYISSVYGGNVLPQMWRIWKHLNAAAHEGTTVGVTLRKLAGETNPNAIRQARKHAADLVGDVRLRGSSEVAKAVNATIPFSGAMLQAFSTLGRAMKKAGWKKTMGVFTAGIGMPTALEVTYNSLLDPTKTFADPADPSKQWTYRDYYWKGFTKDQRNNNMIVFNPGKPPWEAILIPIVPEISMLRGVTIDGMEAAFGLSESGLDQGNHFLAGLGRVFDVPLPPVVAALGSSLGMDLRMGIIPDESDGSGVSFFEGRPLLTGERVSGNFGKAKFVGSEVDKELVAVLQDIFGAAGATGVAVYEAMNPGIDESVATRGEYALDELGRNALRQARYLQPLFGKALRPNPNNDIARSVVHKKDALTRAKKDLDAVTSGLPGGAAAFSADDPVRGNTFEVPADPIARALAASVDPIMQPVKLIDTEISKLRKQISTLGTATVDMYTGKRLTVKSRDDLIDSLNLQISAFKAQQLSILNQAEEQFAETVGQWIGRDLTGFKFDSFKKRPNP